MASVENIGTIVGGTAAGVIALMLVTVSLLCYWRYKRRIGRSSPITEPNLIDPFASPRRTPPTVESSSPPVYQTSIGFSPIEFGSRSNAGASSLTVQPTTPSVTPPVSGAASSSVTALTEQAGLSRDEVSPMRVHQVDFGSEPLQDLSDDCLCLICRQLGHVVASCPLLHSASTHVRPPWPSPPFEDPASTKYSGTALCDRCERLDASVKSEDHVPWVLDDLPDLSRAKDKARQIPSLGPIHALRLRSSCPLCRLLFDITHLTEEDLEVIQDDLFLATGWSIHRLEKDICWSGYHNGKGPYAKCMYTSVARMSDHPGVLVGEAVEAIALMDAGERDGTSKPAPLSVRKVDPQTCDYNLIKDWLCRCDDLHPITCRPLKSHGLKQIKLIDVETRQIVQYPADGCDYVALSYVWGGVQQPSFRLGEILPTVPATIEDAMVVTRNLGKRYFWADSLCIDQGNDEEKAVQIALMSAIYTGAWATIFCLFGHSAWSGLPRVGTLEGVIPQLSCKVWGRRLLSVMPTLDQQMSWSPWATRAWTFQEGLLSPRRIFFTNHQVYFECNVVQSCESLDDAHSPFHLPTDAQRLASLDQVIVDSKTVRKARPDEVFGRGIFRDPFRPLSPNEDAQIDNRLVSYLRLVHTYTSKNMSHASDSLNAFSAVLTRLAETRYQKGFVQGLPLDLLPRALLWIHDARPTRRHLFPTWSWAGWEGPVNEDPVEVFEMDSDWKEVDLPPLRAWKVGHGGAPELVYYFNPTSLILQEIQERSGSNDSDTGSSGPILPEPEDEDGPDLWEDIDDESESDLEDEGSINKPIDRQGDPVTLLAREMLSATPEVPERIGNNELLVEGIVLRLTLGDDITSSSEPDYSTDDGFGHTCTIHLQGRPKPLSLNFVGYNDPLLVQEWVGKEKEFLCYLGSRFSLGQAFGIRYCFSTGTEVLRVGWVWRIWSLTM